MGYCKATPENSKLPTYGRQWGLWIEWNGGDHSPGLEERFVQVHRRSPNSDHWIVDEAHHIEWTHANSPNDVLAYRVEIDE